MFTIYWLEWGLVQGNVDNRLTKVKCASGRECRLSWWQWWRFGMGYPQLGDKNPQRLRCEPCRAVGRGWLLRYMSPAWRFPSPWNGDTCPASTSEATQPAHRLFCLWIWRFLLHQKLGYILMHRKVMQSTWEWINSSLEGPRITYLFSWFVSIQGSVEYLN